MALHKSFALPPDQLFDWIEEVPIACGSIGQVHRAQLSEKGAALACVDPGEVVAVKVGCDCCLGVAQLVCFDCRVLFWGCV
jgi:predicted unusual protein kinase regulating ubiquinone biosynthesis (AarF/ABC1/UbiB family)